MVDAAGAGGEHRIRRFRPVAEKRRIVGLTFEPRHSSPVSIPAPDPFSTLVVLTRTTTIFTIHSVRATVPSDLDCVAANQTNGRKEKSWDCRPYLSMMSPLRSL